MSPTKGERRGVHKEDGNARHKQATGSTRSATPSTTEDDGTMSAMSIACERWRTAANHAGPEAAVHS